jgi:hypothetical protein
MEQIENEEREREGRFRSTDDKLGLFRCMEL